MYGLIAKLTTTPGRRDALQAILLENEGGMPGCRIGGIGLTSGPSSRVG